MSTPFPPDGPPPQQPGSGPPPYSSPIPGYGAPYPADAPLPGSGAPVGYSPYGQPLARPGFSGLAIAGFVLALIGFVPCFWFWFQLPGLLAVIFCVVALGATKESAPGGAKRGRGLAVAGLVIGVVTLLITAGFTAYIYSSDDCMVDGMSVRCNFDAGN